MTTELQPQWRAKGAKRFGARGWSVRPPRRDRFWLITAAPIEWPTETFWWVGLCDHEHHYSGMPVEVAHLRTPTEADALEAVTWLAAVARHEGAHR